MRNREMIYLTNPAREPILEAGVYPEWDREDARYKLRSLYDVMQFYADRLMRLMEELRNLESEALYVWTASGVDEAKEKRVKDSVHAAGEHCKYLDLTSAYKQVTSIWRALISPGGCPLQQLSLLIQELRKRITEDLQDRLFFYVPASQAEYYTDYATLFGKDSCSKFPSALIDIEESCKCLVASRTTACVFHLMRVMEAGLRSLGKSLNNPNIDPKRNPSWGSILKKCDDELQKPLKDRCPEWQTDDQFFSEATANLRAVKNAWRNPTMHVEINYDDERAREVWSSVRAFMRHLSLKLAE